jgi:pyrroline-5-carboxylate reductase
MNELIKMRIGVFGCGNMGRALVLGMRSNYSDAEFFLYTPSQEKARALALEVQGHLVQRIQDMPKDLDWYLLAFKPQSLESFEFVFTNKAKIISVLAGVNTAKLIEKFHTPKVARLMPNIASSVGKGANLFFLNPAFNSKEEMDFFELLVGAGKLFKMNSEKDIDLATAFSGSGPALLFELARIFESELEAMTGGRLPAKAIIAQTFLGSAELMQSDLSFAELSAQVTSKKGVTHEALESLKKNNLQSIFHDAFHAAYKRTLELSQ